MFEFYVSVRPPHLLHFLEVSPGSQPRPGGKPGNCSPPKFSKAFVIAEVQQQVTVILPPLRRYQLNAALGITAFQEKRIEITALLLVSRSYCCQSDSQVVSLVRPVQISCVCEESCDSSARIYDSVRELRKFMPDDLRSSASYECWRKMIGQLALPALFTWLTCVRRPNDPSDYRAGARLFLARNRHSRWNLPDDCTGGQIFVVWLPFRSSPPGRFAAIALIGNWILGQCSSRLVAFPLLAAIADPRANWVFPRELAVNGAVCGCSLLAADGSSIVHSFLFFLTHMWSTVYIICRLHSHLGPSDMWQLKFMHVLFFCVVARMFCAGTNRQKQSLMKAIRLHRSNCLFFFV